MAAEFKIGRLRFNWKGAWTPGSTYARDDVIFNDGSAYVCLVPGIASANFYTDLYAVPYPVWQKVTDGKTWAGAWVTAHSYGVNHVVTFGGQIYYANTAHTSTTFAADISKWTKYTQFVNWNTSWSYSKVYGVGDVVKYGATVYTCIANHTSAALTDKISVTVTGASNNSVILGVTGASGTGSVVTLTYTTQSSAPYTAGQSITVSGIISSSGNYNGTYTVLTSSTTQVTFNGSATGSYTSGGSIQGPATINTLTFASKTPQPFSIGQSVTISNVGSSAGNYNGTFTVLTASATQITYSNTAAGAYTTGGTIAGPTTLGLEGNLSSWTVLNKGIEYKGTWTSGTRYKLNDVVKLDADLYICSGWNADVTFTTANWTLYLPGIQFSGVWASNITYQPGDVVSYGGYDYICVTNNNTNNIPSIDAVDWLLMTQGYEWKSDWNSSTSYKIGDVVRVNGNLYEATVDSSGQNPTLSGNTGINTTYTASGSSGTTLKVASNTNIVPGMIVIGAGFTLGQTVVSTTGSTTVILNRAPDGTVTNGQALSFVGVNSAYWTLVVPGVLWATKWQAITQYYVGDLVVYKNITYICIQNNSSQTSQTSRPDLDVTNQFWSIYIAHSRKNALTNFGDLESYNNGSYSAIPIGTASYLLRNTNAFPTWSKINVIGDVFYVSPTGIDRSDYGTTWDQPWKTINYACSQVSVLRGTNAVSVNIAENVTIFVKSGTYSETLPISVPASVAIVGDELRGTVVQPAVRIIATCTSSTATGNAFTVNSTTGMTANMPVQFTAPLDVNGNSQVFGGITSGQTYYIVSGSITPTQFSVSNTAGGSAISVTLGSGSMTVYAGDCLKNMFLMRDGTGLRNMTFQGLLGSLATADSYTIQRPTGGAYASLDPGIGPTDSSTWITKRSPYVQNVSTFGIGAVGMKIDGSLHNGGNKSMVANDFTQIISDGIGIWCTGSGALTECISVFCYYGYSGYFAEGGGRIRAANGNSSYGTYGVIAEGYDTSETPSTGLVFNQSTQTQAQVQSAFGTTAQILRLNFSNAGSGYYTTTTNLLKYSNNFTGSSWTVDNNVSANKIYTALTGNAEAWSLTGASATPGANYVYENIPITPAGATYTGLSAVNITGSGTGAVFTVTVTSTGYVVTPTFGGSGYAVYNAGAGSSMYISGSQLGGLNSVNDCIITVSALTGSSILNVNVSGTVPAGSAQSYTCSLYVKQGTAPTIAIAASFTGTSGPGSYMQYNFASGTITVGASGGGYTPTQYGAINASTGTTSSAGWYRIWFATNDPTGLNNNIQFTIYPTGYTSPSAGTYSYVYGSQVELSTSAYTPSFYLEVAGATRYTAYSNYNIVGAGTGVITVGDELRSNAVFQTRVTTDSTGFTGGSGYLTASNNAQSGTSTSITLSGADNNGNANYTGMRIFVNSGLGAGQYGYISYYNSSTKVVQVLKESFDVIGITNTTASTNIITLGSNYTTDTLYQNMPVQFIPTYYTTTISSTSLAQTTVTASTGGSINTLTVASTVGLNVNTAVIFSGSVFTSVNPGTVYYIQNIIDSQTIQLSSQIFGTVWQLNTATGNMTMSFSSNTSYLVGSTTNMVVNYPIQFTGTAIGGLTVGTTYYINDIISASSVFNPTGIFTISGSLTSVTVTNTSSSNNTFSVSSTANLIVLNPIIFTAPIIGGSNIVDGTKYYISTIPNSSTFTVASSLLTVTATATQIGTNLITVSSTSGFVANQPIQFVGVGFGNIVPETTYYILAVNNLTTFTVSQTPGGAAYGLATATGNMTARTCPSPVLLSSGSGGSMVGTTTTKKTSLTLGTGSMTGTFSTALFGGVTLGTTYYISNITAGGGGSSSTIQVSAVSNGSAITLTTKSGAMNLAAVGWDHINIGTLIQSALDYTSIYYIEPRTTYSDPTFTMSPANGVVALATGTSWTSIAYGNNLFMALPNGNASGATSTDGSFWTSFTLPTTATWSGVAYGNGYWVIIANGSGTSYYSNSNGLGWRSSSLPSTTSWSNIIYGNGVFVAIATGTNLAAYSTNNGYTWTQSYLPSNHVFTATGNAQLSTAQQKVGASSLYLDGTTNTYIQSPSNADYTLGTGDFTIEAWVYRTSSPGANQIIVDLRPSGSSSVSPTLFLSTTYIPTFFVNGSNAIVGSAAVPLNTWTHIAISRNSGFTTMWVNGSQSGSTYTDSNSYIQGPITIGANQPGASLFIGYIDEVRIQKGIGKYTTTFTPSTTPFLSDSYTLVLLHFEGLTGSTVMTSSDGSPNWTSVAYGNGIFVAAASGTSSAAYSVNGINWSSSTMPANTNWSAIAYGNNLFHAVSSSTNTTAYTFDGITWYSSNLTIAADRIAYGNGVFVAVKSGSNIVWTTEGGTGWKKQTVLNTANYGAMAFGFTSSTYNGVFSTLADQTTGYTIVYGARTKGRALISSGVMTGISEWEPGANYQSTPTVTFTDPNVTTLAQVTPRISSGVLSSPSMVNKGNGYNTNSTYVSVTGNGFADSYQVGLTLVFNGLTSLPAPGASLTILGNTTVYKVTSAYAVFGTVAPNLEANVSISPAMTTALSPANGTQVSIRSKYSQARLTNHDFLNIGYGNIVNSNYPGFPAAGYVALANNQTIEANYGRVFYTSTDQDGNFKVGSLFGVQQATGIVTLSASQFGLTGLQSLALGGISVGGSSVVVTQFSTDATFTANSDSILPTQKAIKSYITSRLSQGGSNTFTGQLTAGTVIVGGPNRIGTTVTNGSVKMGNKVNFQGALAAVDGNMAALDFFLRNGIHR